MDFSSVSLFFKEKGWFLGSDVLVFVTFSSIFCHRRMLMLI